MFSNAPRHRSGAVRITSSTGQAAIEVTPARLSAWADRVVLAVFADEGASLTAAQLPDLQARLAGVAGGSATIELASAFREARLTAVIGAELYRRQGEWKVRAVGEGYSAGLDELLRSHGVVVDDEPLVVPVEPLITNPSAGRPPAAPTHPAPTLPVPVPPVPMQSAQGVCPYCGAQMKKALLRRKYTCQACTRHVAAWATLTTAMLTTGRPDQVAGRWSEMAAIGQDAAVYAALLPAALEHARFVVNLPSPTGSSRTPRSPSSNNGSQPCGSATILWCLTCGPSCTGVSCSPS